MLQAEKDLDVTGEELLGIVVEERMKETVRERVMGVRIIVRTRKTV